MKRLLAHRDARLFLIGQSLSLLGDTALWLALGLWVKELTGSSAAAGLVILCIVAPGLLSPLGGLLVDRFPRRSVLLVVNPLTALIVLPLLLVNDAGDVWLIYLVTLAYGASYVILAAGQSALLTTLLPEELLGPANAALQTVRETLRLVAPVAGAGLYTVAGGGAVAVLDAATFLMATAALFALKAREPRPKPQTVHWLEQTAAGARHIARTPELKRLVLATALSMLVIGFGETLLYELPARARQAGLVRRRADGHGRDRGDHRRAHGHAGDAAPRRDRARGPRHDDLRHRLPADHGFLAARRAVRQGAVQPRRAVDVHRRGHPAAAHDPGTAAGPRVRGERIRHRRSADARNRDRRRAGGHRGLPASTAGRSRRDRRDRRVPAD